MANDYTSKGDEELIEVKIGDDLIFIEKKFIIVNPTAVLSKEPDSTETEIIDNSKPIKEDDDDDDDDDISFSLDSLSADIQDISDDPIEPDEKEDGEDSKVTEPIDNKKKEISLDDIEDDDIKISVKDLDDEHRSSQEDLQQKLRNTLEDLQEIKKDMKNTFTSTETISTAITSIKGMIDALRKDQLTIQENMKIDESIVLDPKKNIQEFKQMQETLVKMGEKAISKDPNGPPAMIEEAKRRVEMSKEWIKRADSLLNSNDISKAIIKEKEKTYPNKTIEDKFVNKLWFDSLKFWLSLVAKMN